MSSGDARARGQAYVNAMETDRAKGRIKDLETRVAALEESLAHPVIRPEHQGWSWTRGDRVSFVDSNLQVFREPDGTMEFRCDGCGVTVSGPEREVQVIMVIHLTTAPRSQ